MGRSVPQDLEDLDNIEEFFSEENTGTNYPTKITKALHCSECGGPSEVTCGQPYCPDCWESSIPERALAWTA